MKNAAIVGVLVVITIAFGLITVKSTVSSVKAQAAQAAQIAKAISE